MSQPTVVDVESPFFGVVDSSVDPVSESWRHPQPMLAAKTLPEMLAQRGPSLNNLKYMSLCIDTSADALKSGKQSSRGHLWDASKRTHSETDENNESLSVRKDLENIMGIIKI